jgi:riboflavin biosynthesis pyrimidine reductase
VVCVPDINGRWTLPLCWHLAQRGVNEVHVESGPRLSGAFLGPGWSMNRCATAPCILGSDARGWFDDLNPVALDQKVVLTFQMYEWWRKFRIIARPVK